MKTKRNPSDDSQTLDRFYLRHLCKRLWTLEEAALVVFDEEPTTTNLRRLRKASQAADVLPGTDSPLSLTELVSREIIAGRLQTYEGRGKEYVYSWDYVRHVAKLGVKISSSLRQLVHMLYIPFQVDEQVHNKTHSVTEASNFLAKYDGNISLKGAKGVISKACTDYQNGDTTGIKSSGKGRERRINKNAFLEWVFVRISNKMDQDTEEIERYRGERAAAPDSEPGSNF